MKTRGSWWTRGGGVDRLARSARAVWVEAFALKDPDRAAAEPEGQNAPVPRALRRIAEREWPANVAQYRGLSAIQAHRRKALWLALIPILVLYALAALAPRGPQPLLGLAFLLAFGVVVFGAGYYGAAAIFSRCPRCSRLFHVNWWRLPLGPAVLLWRRCGHCALNLDTTAPPLRGYFCRLLGAPEEGRRISLARRVWTGRIAPWGRGVSDRLEAWRWRAHERAPWPMRIGEAVLFVAVSLTALVVITVTL